MKRGEIYWADLDPTVGAEIKKRRPVVIVSNDLNNRFNTVVTVLPVTSSIRTLKDFEVFLPKEVSGLSKDSKAQAQQVRTVSKERLTGKAGNSLPPEVMKKVDGALRLHLGLL